MRPRNLRRLAKGFTGKRHGIPCGTCPRRLCFEKKDDTLRFESLLQLGGNFRIFARNNLWPAMNDSGSTPESAKHLAEFEPNVASAQNNQVLWNRCKLHDAFVC